MSASTSIAAAAPGTSRGPIAAAAWASGGLAMFTAAAASPRGERDLSRAERAS